MAFSMLDFVGSQISLRCAHNRGMAKFHFVNDGANQSSKLELPKNGPASGRLLFCKRECIDFEERTSANEIASLLDCTSWTGAGPGLMDAVTKGALEAGKLVGGFKISREAGEWTATNFHPYLPSETYLTCRFFSARKHGLVDAAVRNTAADRTAVVALPGGIGTLDEMFEVLTLIQLERIGSKLPVPFLLMNYDSFYSKLLGFLDDCEDWGTVSKGEVASLWKVCNDNSEALEYLEKFYN
ncbi:probable cytokinin riboside 5'-monophosphate phosphoribohydrolase LOGL10 isoform X2 [Telopea speciosissima]|uniref:probable cytokinin riboside 5'-monophosphate phosphoribohydrolase LOGL10 isoform X2 n=1 Tax=Telopea speciosissima TaxID=54955 RepID=UPI001CC36511|nr:probable cytokinin riboside 5'-monophosphate phosphoribohydrolase LOGL10 isoform X2 [Telopea speciosissima]